MSRVAHPPVGLVEQQSAGTARPSPLPPAQDPGPAASVRYRLSQPRRGIASVMGTNDHVTAPMRTNSSDSPGWLAIAGGRRPVPDFKLWTHQKTGKSFLESGNLLRWRVGPS
jgi:hypothetical protein